MIFASLHDLSRVKGYFQLLLCEAPKYLILFPALCDTGLPCSCPIEAKSYEFKTTVNTPKNDYGWLGTGDFYYKVRVAL